jgi:flagellar protein FlaG
MNVSPSDTDVGKGYSLADSAAISAATSQASTASQANTSGQTSSMSAATAEAQGSTSAAASNTAASQDDGTDARSKAVQAGADKTTAKETAQQLKQQFLNSDTGLKIRVLDDTGHTIQVEIVDKKSEKVLRQIPQDEMLKLSASMKKMTGVLLNKPA